MSSLRQIKKNIKSFCNDLTAECVIADTLGKNVDSKKLADVVYNTVKLKYDSLKKVSVAFPKTPKDFANKAEYNKARKKYFKQAFASLDTIFFKEIDGLVAQLNKAVPKSEA